MSKIEKIKRTILISIGFALATYLIMSGSAMLDEESVNLEKEAIHVKHTAQ